MSRAHEAMLSDRVYSASEGGKRSSVPIQDSDARDRE
jgi:hypothetical protein